MNNKVSIGIITRGQELASLQETLSFVRQFSYENSEIVIFDNGSTDSTKEYCLAQSDIKYFRSNENLGTSKARNRIAKESSGEYLLFLDNDVILRDKDLIEQLIEFYANIEKPGFVIIPLVDSENMETGVLRHYGAYYSFYGIMRNPRVNIKSILNYPSNVKVASIFSAAMFFSRKVWDDLGGFDESQLFNCDDDDIGTRAMVYGYYNYLYNKVFGEHTGNRSRRKGNKEMDAWKYELYFSGKARAMVKNFQFSTLIWLMPIFCLATMYMATKWVIENKYPKYYLSLFTSIKTFIRNYSDTLAQRKIVQSKRKFSDKVIFSIKCPEYESRNRLRRLFPF
jgi:GT2 family glycosyltransferase